MSVPPLDQAANTRLSAGATSRWWRTRRSRPRPSRGQLAGRGRGRARRRCPAARRAGAAGPATAAGPARRCARSRTAAPPARPGPARRASSRAATAAGSRRSSARGPGWRSSSSSSRSGGDRRAQRQQHRRVRPERDHARGRPARSSRGQRADGRRRGPDPLARASSRRRRPRAPRRRVRTRSRTMMSVVLGDGPLGQHLERAVQVDVVRAAAVRQAQVRPPPRRAVGSRRGRGTASRAAICRARPATSGSAVDRPAGAVDQLGRPRRCPGGRAPGGAAPASRRPRSDRPRAPGRRRRPGRLEQRGRLVELLRPAPQRAGPAVAARPARAASRPGTVSSTRLGRGAAAGRSGPPRSPAAPARASVSAVSSRWIRPDSATEHRVEHQRPR